MRFEHGFMGSSMLNACAYDDETNELTVQFTNGKLYIYEEVPIETYRELISAESAGRYFNSIKKGLKQKADVI